MPDTYGEMLDKMVDTAAKYEERASIFRRNNILKGHFYNVINPNRKTPSGNDFHTPIEWMVSLTRDLSDFRMAKKVATDMGGKFLSPEDIKELKSILTQAAPDPIKILEIVQKMASTEA